MPTKEPRVYAVARPFFSTIGIAESLHIQTEASWSCLARQHGPNGLWRGSPNCDVEVGVGDKTFDGVEVVRSVSAGLCDDWALPFKNEVENVLTGSKMAILIQPKSASDKSLNAQHVFPRRGGEQWEYEFVELKHRR